MTAYFLGLLTIPCVILLAAAYRRAAYAYGETRFTLSVARQHFGGMKRWPEWVWLTYALKLWLCRFFQMAGRKQEIVIDGTSYCRVGNRAVRREQ